MSICREARSRTIRVPSAKEARWESRRAVSTGNYPLADTRGLWVGNLSVCEEGGGFLFPHAPFF